MDILFIFTRGPQMGSKILVEDAKNIAHAMDMVRKELPADIVRSDVRDNSSVLIDVFDSHDFEVMHIRRKIDADPAGTEPENHLMLQIDGSRYGRKRAVSDDSGAPFD